MHRKPFAGSRRILQSASRWAFSGLSVRRRGGWPLAGPPELPFSGVSGRRSQLPRVVSTASRAWMVRLPPSRAGSTEIQKILCSVPATMKAARARKREKQQIVPLAPIGTDVRQRASKDASRKMKLILQVRPLILARGGYCRRFSHSLEHRQSWHARLACKCMHAHHTIWESLTQVCAYQSHTHAQQFSVSVRSQRHQISLTR